jgi:hypothetical protein
METMMRARPSWRRLAAALALSALCTAGCVGSYNSASGTTGSGGGGGSSSGNGAMDPGSSSPSGPPPALPPDPNGFQLTVAPVLDAQGCTECHHRGRPIDLTQYPFMAGDAQAAAQKLIDSFGQMPPAPRDPAPASLPALVTQWKAAGMKP